MEPSVRENMRQTMTDCELLILRIQFLAGATAQKIISADEFSELSKKYINMLRKELGLNATDASKSSKLILLSPRSQIIGESATPA